MIEASWVQVVVSAAAIFGTALKLPNAKLEWAEEHRCIARIKRYKDVMDLVEHPRVLRLLKEDNEWHALYLVALLKIPYKLQLRLAIHLVWIGYLGSTALVVCSLVFDWGWIYFGLGIFLLVLVYYGSFPISSRYLVFQANRRAFVLSGAPKMFRLANQAMVPQRGEPNKRRNIYSEFDARVKDSDYKRRGLNSAEFAPEAYAIWTQILDEQKAMWHDRGEKLRERLVEVNNRHPNPKRYEKLEGILLRGQERLKPKPPQEGGEGD